MSKKHVPIEERKKAYIRSGCLLCAQSVCDECGPSPGVPPASYWQRGFEQGYAGEIRPGYSMRLPGFANGYDAGRTKRKDELEARELGIKDHQIAQAVNELTAIAREYGHSQQLRDRISRVVVRLVRGR
jgi:hypothetical protein